MAHDKIKCIPKHKKITYTRLVVNFLPHKDDPNRIRIIVGRNLTLIALELTTHTSNLTTAKILWNSVMSTEGVEYAVFDVSNTYFHTSLVPADYDYMRIPLQLIPEHIITQYTLHEYEKGVYVYVKMQYYIYYFSDLLTSIF